MLMKGAGETDVSAVKRAPCFSRGPDISSQHVCQAAYNQPPLIAAPEVVMASSWPLRASAPMGCTYKDTGTYIH